MNQSKIILSFKNLLRKTCQELFLLQSSFTFWDLEYLFDYYYLRHDSQMLKWNTTFLNAQLIFDEDIISKKTYPESLTPRSIKMSLLVLKISHPQQHKTTCENKDGSSILTLCWKRFFQIFYDKIIWKDCNIPWAVNLIVNLSSFQNLQTIVTWPQGVSFSLVHNFRLPRSPHRERCVMKNELKIWAIQRLWEAWETKISPLETRQMSQNSFKHIFRLWFK